MCTCVWMSVEVIKGIKSLGDGLTSSCELPGVGAGKGTPVL